MDHRTWFDANAGWIGFAGFIVGILGILTGFLFFWWSRRPKKFGWQLMSETSILTADAKGLPLKITYADQHKVTRPNLIVLRFGNRGKVEIRAEDYDRPVTVTFNSTKLIGSTLIDGLHLNFNTVLSQETNSVIFTPPMLNKGEWLDLQLVTDGPLEIPKIDVRIAGQSGPIGELASSYKRITARLFRGAIVATAVGFLFLIYAITIRAVSDSPILIFAVWMLLGGLILFLAGQVRYGHTPSWRKEPKKSKNIWIDNAIIRLYREFRNG